MNAEENQFVNYLKRNCIVQVNHDCCYVCARGCTCGNHEKHSDNLRELETATVKLERPTLSRSVNDDERSLLKEGLLENLTSYEYN